MDVRPDVVTEGYRLLENHLQRAGLTPNPLETVTLEELRAWLTEGVRYLLDKNMEGLLQLCYRIDLSEAQVNRILTTAPPDDIAPQIAEQILQREFQKVHFRQKYRNQGDS